MSFDRVIILKAHIVLTILGLGNSQKPKIMNLTDTRPNGRNKWTKIKNVKTQITFTKTKVTLGIHTLKANLPMKITSIANSMARNQNGRRWTKNGSDSRRKATIEEKTMRGTMSVKNKKNKEIRIIVILSIEGRRGSSQVTLLLQLNLRLLYLEVCLGWLCIK